MVDSKTADRVRLSDEVSIGLLATVFPDDRVVAAIEAAGVKEQRNRALPARLMVYVRHEALRCIPDSVGRNSEGCSWV